MKPEFLTPRSQDPTISSNSELDEFSASFRPV